MSSVFAGDLGKLGLIKKIKYQSKPRGVIVLEKFNF